MAVFVHNHKATAAGSVSPVGKLTDQHRILRQRQRAEERQRRLLFGIADDLYRCTAPPPAPLRGAGHPAPRRAGTLPSAVGCISCSAPGSQPKLNSTQSTLPGCTSSPAGRDRKSTARPILSYPASFKRRFVRSTAWGWISMPSTRPFCPARRQRNSVSLPLPQVASETTRRGSGGPQKFMAKLHRQTSRARGGAQPPALG